VSLENVVANTVPGLTHQKNSRCSFCQRSHLTCRTTRDWRIHCYMSTSNQSTIVLQTQNNMKLLLNW